MKYLDNLENLNGISKKLLFYFGNQLCKMFFWKVHGKFLRRKIFVGNKIFVGREMLDGTRKIQSFIKMYNLREVEVHRTFKNYWEHLVENLMNEVCGYSEGS